MKNIRMIYAIVCFVLVFGLIGCKTDEVLRETPVNNEESFASGDWPSRSLGVQAAEDMIKLADMLSDREKPLTTKDEVESIIGIVGSNERYEGRESQKDVYDFEYPDGNRLEITFWEDWSPMHLRIADERQFIDKNIVSPDLTALDLDSTYEDYVRVLGAEGILISVAGNNTRTYLWVNSEGRKLEARFNAQTGEISTSYNYF